MNIRVPLEHFILEGILTIPDSARGIVVFAHPGMGGLSNLLNTHNTYVTEVLFEAHFGSLLAGLLTEEEERSKKIENDIWFLTDRLEKLTAWIQSNEQTRDLRIGYFGVGTGAAAALAASLDVGSAIRAVVCDSGRLDLVMDILSRVQVPTRLVVRGNDDVVHCINERSYDLLMSDKELDIVPGAPHVFDERFLNEVARLSVDWFSRYLPPTRA